MIPASWFEPIDLRFDRLARGHRGLAEDLKLHFWGLDERHAGGGSQSTPPRIIKGSSGPMRTGGDDGDDKENIAGMGVVSRSGEPAKLEPDWYPQ